MSPEILTAALRVRDLQEQADRAEVHGNTMQFLQALGYLTSARTELERLNQAERERRARNGGAL